MFFSLGAEYPGDTELHLVWDIDQSKLVGEGTNDVELVNQSNLREICIANHLTWRGAQVIKCVLWWKEELNHDHGFIPSSVPESVMTPHCFLYADSLCIDSCGASSNRLRKSSESTALLSIWRKPSRTSCNSSFDPRCASSSSSTPRLSKWHAHKNQPVDGALCGSEPLAASMGLPLVRCESAYMT
jgi:hypothetical protein